MKKVRMLHVEWNDRESATYYVDKDKYSIAHFDEVTNQTTLDTYSGTYRFYHDSGVCTLDTGPEIKESNVKSFKTYLSSDINGEEN